MKLLRQNDKIVLYDDVKDQYIQVEPDDLDHILNDNNELYDDETIRHYFNFKLGKYQIKNQKGYQSKKANLREEYKQQMTQTQKNYLINQFLSGIYGLSENDKLMFIKNPTISTIKKFSVDERSKNKLIDKFEKINKSYITFKDEGNDIDDMINYYNKNNVPVEIPQVIKAVIYKLIEEYEKNEINEDTLKSTILSYKNYFYNPAKPNAFKVFNDFINKIINNKKATDTKKDIKDIKPIETKEIKEIKEAEEILNDVLPDNKINKVFLAADFGTKEAADKANILNQSNKLTTQSLFSDSTFNEYNHNYFAQNSKFYRIFKYLTDKDLLKDYEINGIKDKKDIKEVILNLKEDNGQIKINIDKNQFLGDEIEKELKKTNPNIDEIFKDGNDKIDMIKSTSRYSQPYEYIDTFKNKDINELFKDKELDKVIDKVSNDISNYEFAALIDDYYENFNDDDEVYIDPTIKFNPKSSFKYIEKFDDEAKIGINSKPYQRLFKVLPRSVVGKLQPAEILEWAHNKVFKYVEDYDQKINDKKKEIYELNEKLGNQIKNKKITENALKELQKQIKDKKTPTEEDNQDIKEFNDNIDKYQKEIKNLKTNIGEIQTKIDEMEAIKGKNFEDDEKFKKSIELAPEQLNKIPGNYQDKINDILADYASEFLMENKFYTDTYSTVKDQSKTNRVNKKIDPTLQNIYKKRRYLEDEHKKRKNQLIEDLNSAGSWSYDVLKRIDNLNNILKSSGSWSYDVLKRIDNLNNILKSSGSWSYDVLKRIDNLNELINN
jgi:hypothetical protein